jgi:hypothetical protein
VLATVIMDMYPREALMSIMNMGTIIIMASIRIIITASMGTKSIIRIMTMKPLTVTSMIMKSQSTMIMYRISIVTAMTMGAWKTVLLHMYMTMDIIFSTVIIIRTTRSIPPPSIGFLETR